MAKTSLQDSEFQSKPSTINRQPDKPQLQAPLADITFLLNAHCDDRAKRNKKLTGTSLKNKLKHFRAFWEQNGAAMGWILSPDSLIEFSAWLDKRKHPKTGAPLAWNTRNDALRRLRQCLRWAVAAGYVSDPRLITNVPHPNGPKKVYRPAPGLEVWRAIWRTLDQSATPCRDKAIFALLAGTGARVGEVAALRAEDVELLSDMSGFVAIRTSKTGEGRRVAFDNVVGQVLAKHLKTTGVKRGPLFFAMLREPIQCLAVGSVQRILRQAADNAGVGAAYSGSHDFRRAFARQWSVSLPGEGYSWLLARQLGHTITSMTAYYSRTDGEDIRLCLMKNRCSLFAQMFGKDKA